MSEDPAAKVVGRAVDEVRTLLELRHDWTETEAAERDVLLAEFESRAVSSGRGLATITKALARADHGDVAGARRAYMASGADGTLEGLLAARRSGRLSSAELRRKEIEADKEWGEWIDFAAKAGWFLVKLLPALIAVV